MNKKNDFRLTESILPFWAKKLSPWHWVPLIREKDPLVCSQKRAQTLTTHTPIRYRPHRPLPGPKVQTARGNCSLNHTATSSTCVLSVTWWPQLSPLVPQAGLVTSFFFLISDVVFSRKLVHTQLTLSAFLGLCKWHLVFSGIICLKRESLKFCFFGGGGPSSCFHHRRTVCVFVCVFLTWKISTDVSHVARFSWGVPFVSLSERQCFCTGRAQEQIPSVHGFCLQRASLFLLESSC